MVLGASFDAAYVNGVLAGIVTLEYYWIQCISPLMILLAWLDCTQNLVAIQNVLGTTSCSWIGSLILLFNLPCTDTCYFFGRAPCWANSLWNCLELAKTIVCIFKNQPFCKRVVAMSISCSQYAMHLLRNTVRHITIIYCHSRVSVHWDAVVQECLPLYACCLLCNHIASMLSHRSI